MSTESLAIAPLAAPFDVELELPGSKSEANRVLAAAAMCGRPVDVFGATACDDVRHMVAGLTALGYQAHFVDAARGHVRVEPRRACAAVGDVGDTAPSRGGELSCGNAGTALRFLVSLAARTPGHWRIAGDAAMERRPIAPLVRAWRALGVQVRCRDGRPPVEIVGGRPDAVGTRVALDPALSSQYASSLMLAALSDTRPFRIDFTAPPASFAYVHLTAQVLRRFGARVDVDVRGVRIAPFDTARVPSTQHVGADWSALGAWTCLAHLTGSRVRATNLARGSGQADEELVAHLDAFDGPGPRTVDVAAVPDQFMNLALVAAASRGTTRFVGAANLRIKECDRLAVTVRELMRLGASAREHADGIEVDGTDRLQPAVVDTAGDHRVAMAFALAGLLSPGVRVREPGCVTKSYPDFFADLERVRSSPASVVLVGMRAAGKSTLARSLGRELGREVIDTDAEIEAVHGPIADQVADAGWSAFRRRESESVLRALATRGRVVALGGGAIETAEVRDALAAHPLVVHVRTPLAVLTARVSAADRARPSVTGGDVRAELAELGARREPLHAAVADLVVDGAMDPDTTARDLAARIAGRCRWPGRRAC